MTSSNPISITSLPDSHTIMADDTRQSDPSATNTEPNRKRRPRSDFPQTQAGKLEAAFGNPKEPVNAIPGGSYNSAGGKPAEVRWWDALSFDVHNSEKRPAFYQTGCARDSMLVGMGAGGAIGGLRFVLKGRMSFGNERAMFQADDFRTHWNGDDHESGGCWICRYVNGDALLVRPTAAGRSKRNGPCHRGNEDVEREKEQGKDRGRRSQQSRRRETGKEVIMVVIR
jgi:hypothetical protein